ncbi:hypothetical protein KUH03_24190 [Sphingobacterium sp. E70]|uniref:hypothetical protein n=1 Tax=Sphingobacterium sp. E70 TaxID=2853439 RepID=UPI00211BAE80|nr:hypothetical protein [Sphingobacterium sp. E70]ULT22491.1 hypothetical protein KUH03_24190 [Sphingobacterium sp. E70]
MVNEANAVVGNDVETEEETANEQREPQDLENDDNFTPTESVAELVEPITPIVEQDTLAENTVEEKAKVEAELLDTVAVSTPIDQNDSQEVAEDEKIAEKEVGAIAAANSAYAPNIYEEEPRNSNAIWYWITAAIVLVMIAVGVLYTNPGLKNSLFGGHNRP